MTKWDDLAKEGRKPDTAASLLEIVVGVLLPIACLAVTDSEGAAGHLLNLADELAQLARRARVAAYLEGERYDDHADAA